MARKRVCRKATARPGRNCVNLADLSLPDFKTLEGVNDVTLTAKHFGRACVVYDVGKLELCVEIGSLPPTP